VAGGRRPKTLKLLFLRRRGGGGERRRGGRRGDFRKSQKESNPNSNNIELH
jgi:hypothetical protein